MQSHFVAIVHNLLLLLQEWHRQQGVGNAAEIQRRQKRWDQEETALKKTGQTLPLLQRFTQAAFKTHPLALCASTGINPLRYRKHLLQHTLPLCQTLTASDPEELRAWREVLRQLVAEPPSGLSAFRESARRRAGAQLRLRAVPS